MKPPKSDDVLPTFVQIGNFWEMKRLTTEKDSSWKSMILLICKDFKFKMNVNENLKFKMNVSEDWRFYEVAKVDEKQLMKVQIGHFRGCKYQQFTTIIDASLIIVSDSQSQRFW